MINILHQYTGVVLYSSATAQTIADAVQEAVGVRANLYGANLVRAEYWRLLQIQGSVHSCLLYEPATLKIGCEKHHVSDWLKNFESIGKKNGYSAAQIAEYKEYIDLFAKHSARFVISGLTWGWGE